MVHRIAVILCSLAVMAMAQLNRGTIAGTVTDPEGAAIPGASITIRNPATGATIKAQANEYGQFSTPNLQPGTYEVIVEAPGFKRLSRQGITLGATEVRRVDVALEEIGRAHV